MNNWHDLLKNPNDIPLNYKVCLLIIRYHINNEIRDKLEIGYGIEDGYWYVYGDQLEDKDYILYWQYINLPKGDKKYEF